MIYFILLIMFSQTAYGIDYKPSYDICLVTRVIDGDTFSAECKFRGNTTVRIYGIDTYETHINRHIRKQSSDQVLTRPVRF